VDLVRIVLTSRPWARAALAMDLDASVWAHNHGRNPHLDLLTDGKHSLYIGIGIVLLAKLRGQFSNW